MRHQEAKTEDVERVHYEKVVWQGIGISIRDPEQHLRGIYYLI
jgi:hypothetical protein